MPGRRASQQRQALPGGKDSSVPVPASGVLSEGLGVQGQCSYVLPGPARPVLRKGVWPTFYTRGN